MLFDHTGATLTPEAEAQARAEIAAGTRLMRTDSLGDHLFDPAVEPAWRAAWQAAMDAAAVAAAARLAEMADTEAARQFSRLVALRAMSPAQVSTYIATRYPAPAADLPSANAILTKMRDDLETLAIAVSVLARRL